MDVDPPGDAALRRRLTRAQALVARCRIDPSREALAVVLSDDERASRRALRRAGRGEPVPDASLHVEARAAEPAGALAVARTREPPPDPSGPQGRLTVLAADYVTWTRPHFGTLFGVAAGVLVGNERVLAPDVRVKYGFTF